MARITGTNATESAKDQNRPIHLVSVHFDAQTTYTTDAFHNIDYGGNTYNAAGGLLSISDISEQSKIVVSAVKVSLSGVDQTYINLVLAEDYIDRYEGKKPHSLEIFLEYLNMTEDEFNETIKKTAGPPHKPNFKNVLSKRTHDFEKWYREK